MSDIREALSAALEAQTDTTEAAPAPEVVTESVTAAPEVVAEPAAEALPGETEAQTAARVRDEKGRFAPKSKETATATPKPGETAAVTPKDATATATAAPKEATATATPAPELRAPQSWKPEEREGWAKTPPEIQKAVLRREKEIATALQESAPARKFHESFNQVVGPYAAMLQAEGSEPLKAVQSLFNTAYVLRSAPPGQKAQLLAQLVKQYDVPIDALDSALAGVAPAQQQAQPQQPLRDPRFDALIQQAQVAEARKLQTEVQAVSAEAEFFEDVRPMMAKLAASGWSTDVKELYTEACKRVPEVSRVLQQREAAKAAATAQAATQQARHAASSVRSQPAIPHGGGAKPEDTRAILEAAWESARGR